MRKKGSACRAAELERRKEKRKKRRSLEELKGAFEGRRGGRAVAATAEEIAKSIDAALAEETTESDGALDSLDTSCDGEVDRVRKTPLLGQPRDHPHRSEPLTL